MSGKNGNGNRHSQFSVDKDWHAELKKPKVRKAYTKDDVRLSSSKKQADAESGGSAYARLAVAFEKTIKKPIKVDGDDWYLWSGVRWELIGDGKVKFRRIAWDIQERSNKNETAVGKILRCVECRNQIGIDEKFVGALNNNVIKGSYLLNFPNCVLEIDSETGKIVSKRDHKPEYMFTATLGGSYYEEHEFGACYEDFHKALVEILPMKADRILFLDYCTYALTPHSRYQCALFCIGPGGNGKSILADAISNAFGECRSTLTLQQICDNRGKYAQELRDKLINIGDEAEKVMIEDDANYKSIVCGETFNYAPIYKKGTNFQTNCKLLQMSNHDPIFKHGTYANERRFRGIRFMRRFEGEARDLHLKEKLELQKDGIISYLVRRLVKLYAKTEMEQGSFISQKSLESWRLNNNIVDMFWRQCIEKVDTSFLARGTIYRVFQAYCAEKETSRFMGIDQFFRDVKKLYPEINTRVRIRHGGKARPVCCKGVAFSEYGWELCTANRTSHPPQKS